jgi:hypothetical protein
MGRLRINFLTKGAFFGILMLVPLMLIALSDASAQNCSLQNTFPPAQSQAYPCSHFGASRSGGARWHAGVDFFYPKGTKVAIPDGCSPRLYSDGTVIWKSDPTGYGQYMFLNCNVGGVPLTLRYSHINQFTADGQIEQGRTGIETASIPDHFHFEVLISQTPGRGTPVDPDCILGTPKTDGGPQSPIAECNTCPTSTYPVNFCTEPDAVSKLLNHSQTCYKGSDKNNPEGETVDPSRLAGVAQGTPDTSGPVDGTGSYADYLADPGHDYGEPGQNEGYQGNVDDLYPPRPDPPITPPTPPTPGVPGGAASPVIAPSGEVEELSGCATDTWIAMTNQALNQSRREIAFNKRYIVKPDSVLQYSCFEDDLKTVVEHVGPIFSNGTVWENLEVDLIGKSVTIQIYEQDSPDEAAYLMNLLTKSTLEESLVLLVDSTFQNYILGQFNHPFLAGSAPVAGAAAEIANDSYCVKMSNIWKAAKCKNFDDETLFYTMEDFANAPDVRIYPSGANWECQ